MSLGSKEKAWRHLGQNPVVRPGLSPVERPTFVPHAEQNRLSSGTIGSAMTAVEASTAGMGGICVRPAPSLADRIRCEEDVTRRTVLEPPERARAEPMTVADNRLLAAERVEPTGEVTGLSPAALADDPPGAGTVGGDPAAEPQIVQ